MLEPTNYETDYSLHYISYLPLRKSVIHYSHHLGKQDSGKGTLKSGSSHRHKCQIRVHDLFLN